MIKLILVRHTETIWNEEFRYIGSTDMDLSPLGEKHAAMMAAYLGAEDVEAIFASDMNRARQTAAAIAAYHDIKTKYLSELREVGFGAWEGLTYGEIKENYSQIIDDWLDDPLNVTMPGGESWSAFESRVEAGLKKVLDSGINGTIIIVTHGGPIKVIIGQALGIPASSYWQIYQDKGAINEIHYGGGRPRLSLLNDRCYLKTADID